MTLRRFNMVGAVEIARRANRDYMQSHRDEWSNLGFRSITYMVHDSEREFILAELDVRRCDKLIEIAERRGSNPLLEPLSRRNMPKPPTEGTLAAMLTEAADSTVFKDVLALMDIADRMLKKQAAMILLFGRTADRDKRTRIAARGVAYSSAAVARYKLARALLDYAPHRPLAVFGIEGSAAVTEEESWLEENG